MYCMKNFLLDKNINFYTFSCITSLKHHRLSLLLLQGTEELQLFYERDVKKCEIYDEITYCQDKMTEEQMKDIFDEADLEKHRKKNKPLFQATRNSEHLNRLHKIDMEQLLCGAPPPVEEEPLGQYVDIHNFR